MRPIIARAAKRSSRRGAQPQAHRPSRAPARAGRPYPAVNCEIDGAPALFLCGQKIKTVEKTVSCRFPA
jgi:hypothetical protein